MERRPLRNARRSLPANLENAPEDEPVLIMYGRHRHQNNEREQDQQVIIINDDEDNVEQERRAGGAQQLGRGLMRGRRQRRGALVDGDGGEAAITDNEAGNDEGRNARGGVQSRGRGRGRGRGRVYGRYNEHVEQDNGPEPEAIENEEASGDDEPGARNYYRNEHGGRRGRSYYNPYNWPYWSREKYQESVDIDIKNLKTQMYELHKKVKAQTVTPAVAATVPATMISAVTTPVASLVAAPAVTSATSIQQYPPQQALIPFQTPMSMPQTFNLQMPMQIPMQMLTQMPGQVPSNAQSLINPSVWPLRRLCKAMT